VIPEQSCIFRLLKNAESVTENLPLCILTDKNRRLFLVQNFRQFFFGVFGCQLKQIRTAVVMNLVYLMQQQHKRRNIFFLCETNGI
jgi:hypothetical protein